MRKRTAVLIGFFLLLLANATAYSQNTSRISKDELKANLGKVIIIDVRTRGDWDASQWKILGAVREDPMNVDRWKDKYPKDKEIVLYCA